ncbi:MAG TPA: hypothetical protein VMS08_00750 [Candidatus Saccharimonadia bacterium]|nr:hypothetical protein [Candidatus Saccharimonadia bacterium]
MKDDNPKLIFLLWSVIAVLMVGVVIGGFLLVKKDDDLTTTNTNMQGDVESMQSQLKQAKATQPTPSADTDGLSPAPTNPAEDTPSPAAK